MKQFRVLFMLLIGMIGFTAMASTPLTEQKQKIEISKNFQVQEISTNVLFTQLALVDSAVNFLPSKDAQILRITSQKTNNLAIITDVGWRFSRQTIKQIPTTEKLLENYNLHYKSKLRSNPVNRIRDNPFRSNCVFIITKR